MQHCNFDHCIALDITGNHPPRNLIEIIDYNIEDDGTITATAITDLGDVIDVPILDIIPTCAVVLPAVA